MTKPEFDEGDRYSLSNVAKVYDFFYRVQIMAKAACASLEKWASALKGISLSMMIWRSYQAGNPWILHHIKSGIEYSVSGYRSKTATFLCREVDGHFDGIVRAIPMRHVLMGYYALWGN